MWSVPQQYLWVDAAGSQRAALDPGGGGYSRFRHPRSIRTGGAPASRRSTGGLGAGGLAAARARPHPTSRARALNRTEGGHDMTLRFIDTYCGVPPEVERAEPRAPHRVAPAPASELAPAPRAQDANDPFVARMADALTRSVGGRRGDVHEDVAHIERQDPSTGVWRKAAVTRSDPQYLIRGWKRSDARVPRGPGCAPWTRTAACSTSCLDDDFRP
jgi:hypothetical protein